MINCRNCGNENPDDSQYCDECGSPLKQKQNNQTMVEPSVFQTPPLETPFENKANVTSVGIPPIEDENSIAEKDTSDAAETNQREARLIIERGESIGKKFKVAAEESYIGRWDADNGIFPDIDLDAEDQEAKVSRRHARIISQNGRFMIEDLGSTNGTFVNRGRRLIPGTPHVLNDGDEIIVGKTFLRFSIKD